MYSNSFLTASRPETIVYSIIAMFFIYSFIGWIWECLYVWIKDGKLYNRGFLAGPIIPIYGLGGVAIVTGLGDLRDNIALLFFSGIFVCSLLEYITALICEKCFHTKLWDYSDMRFNIKGRVCLIASLMWGFMSVMLIVFIQPVIEAKIMSVPHDIRLVLSSSLLTMLCIDIVTSVISMYNLHDKVKEIMDIDSKLREIEAVRNFEDKAQERSRQRYEESQERIAEREKQKAEMKSKLMSLRASLTSAKHIENRQKRLLKAMPQLKFRGLDEPLRKLHNSLKKHKKK